MLTGPTKNKKGIDLVGNLKEPFRLLGPVGLRARSPCATRPCSLGGEIILVSVLRSDVRVVGGSFKAGGEIILVAVLRRGVILFGWQFRGGG